MAIPIFPGFAPLVLEHKNEVDQAFRQLEPAISELTFTNLFIWRHYYQVCLSRLEGFLLLLAQPATKAPFFFIPWGEGQMRPVIRKCIEFLNANFGGGCIERVPQDHLGKFEVSDSDVRPDPDNDDYVYNSQDLISLKGRKYDGKRNAIRKFQREWRWEYRRIDREMVDLCLALHDFWCTERKCELYPGLMEEKRAIVEAFNNYEVLGIRGGAILIDGKVEAFSLGEKLNSNTFVVHIEKANQGIPGLYTVMNQQFAENEVAAFAYTNREQDLGDEGLRMAKESYQPVFKVQKFKVCPKP